MARIVERFLGTHRVVKEEWLDGQIREFKRGVDFDNKLCFFNNLYQFCYRRGLRGRVEKVDADTFLFCAKPVAR